ncbi:MAG: MBL fold metallo-hydrolase [Nitrospinota bacterium]
MTARVHVLGTSSARPMPNRDHTSLVVDFGGDLTLVDCSANPIGKILRLGLDPLRLGRVVVTHDHPDHTYGFPSVIHSLRTYRPLRREPLAICAPKETVGLLLRLWRAYDFGEPGDNLRFQVSFQEIPLSEEHLLIDGGDYRIRTTPVSHSDHEVVALRFDDGRSGKAMTYSSDTEPCPALERLAAGTDLFIMEATRRGGENLAGHSTGEEAGDLAARAGADRLLLVHVLAGNPSEEAELTAAAAKAFGGPVEIAQDMKTYSF